MQPQTNLKFDGKTWLAALRHWGDYVLVPGSITAILAKAVLFKTIVGPAIWIATSQTQPYKIDGVIQYGGLWVKHWFIVQKLPDLFPTK
jgi:hypothetical protein